MMKRMKLFPKTFIFTLILLLLVIAISHLLIYFLLPAVYNAQQERILEQETEAFIERFSNIEDDARLEAVGGFALDNNADVAVHYDDYTYQFESLNSGQLQAAGSDSEVTIVIGDESIHIVMSGKGKDSESYFYIQRTFDNNKGIIEVIISRQQIDNAVGVIVIILPFTAAICIILSVLFSLYYSRAITRPIKRISALTEEMRELQPDVHFEITTQDEIGVLGANINSLYSDLLKVIRDLEKGIRKVEETEALKTDFLRAASHELKTPVATVSAMLENMLLGVGKYKDHEMYLAKCKEQIERLGDLIKEILDTSRLDGFSLTEEPQMMDIAEMIDTISEPYQLIARAKGINLDIDASGSFEVTIPVRLFEKAVSNVISNAVAYTEKDKNILIYIEDGDLIIENECMPIPQGHLEYVFEPFYRPEYARDRNTGGNGFGLYITKSILKLLDIDYSFTPVSSPPGMRFTFKLI